MSQPVLFYDLTPTPLPDEMGFMQLQYTTQKEGV